MKKVLVPIFLTMSLFLTAARPPVASWTPETKLWLGRSCVGEAGFHAHEECSGIAWTYATRARETGASFLPLVRKYSSPLKRREGHRKPWIFYLGLDLVKPVGWPSSLRWGPYRYEWRGLLRMLDRWALGEVPNPVPGANHFGGKMDTPGSRWKRVYPVGATVVFRNRFYREEVKPGPSPSREARRARP